MADEDEVAVKNTLFKILTVKARPRYWLVNECVRRLEDEVDDEFVNEILRLLLNSKKVQSSIVDGVETISLA